MGARVAGKDEWSCDDEGVVLLVLHCVVAAELRRSCQEQGR